MGVDANVDIGLIDHAKRNFDTARILRRLVFHSDRKNTLTEACFAGFVTVFWQVVSGAADHGGDRTRAR
jgi:hypothetical protein